MCADGVLMEHMVHCCQRVIIKGGNYLLSLSFTALWFIMGHSAEELVVFPLKLCKKLNSPSSRYNIQVFRQVTKDISEERRMPFYSLHVYIYMFCPL